MANDPVLLSDVGATNIRFALFSNGSLGPIEWMKSADYSQFPDAITAFLERRNHPPITSALLAVAGPVEDGVVRFTNRGWVIDAAAIREKFHLRSVRIINDFAATGWALPDLRPEDLHPIGEGRPIPGAVMAVLGPGSGLGVACYVPLDHGGLVMASEGGHASLATSSEREDRVLQHLRERFGHVSRERVLSGPGLENLYSAIAAIADLEVPVRDAPAITLAGLEGTCPTSRAALDMFCAFLGAIAGDIALSYGARGGIFIAGGIAPRILPFLEQSEFRQRFAAKGRMRGYVEPIPASVITHPDVTFVGLQSLARNDNVIRV
jgi:glucokinase